MTSYVFNVATAQKYGLEEAVMISNIQFWVMQNKSQGKNSINGRTWTYNSIEAFGELFPFWTQNQVRRILQSLIKQEVLITGNYNKFSYDRTLWYAFLNEEEFVPAFQETNNRRAGHIYLLKKGSYYKIGLSSDINQRLKRFPDYEVVEVFESHDVFKDEKTLHKMFEDNAIGGEWFELNGSDINKILIFNFSQMEDGENQNGIVQNHKPIPDNKPDNKPDIDPPIPPLPEKFVLPNWVPKQDWDDFLEVRKKKRAPATRRAFELLITKLNHLRGKGYDPPSVLQQSIERGYTGLFELKGDYSERNNFEKRSSGNSDQRSIADDRLRDRVNATSRFIDDIRGT